MHIKHLRHSALLALAALASLPALAADAATSGNAGAVTAKKAYLDPLTAKRMQGVYRLDDGRTLRVSEAHRRLYADVGGGPLEIVHVGHDRFEAVGSDLSLGFEGGTHPHSVVVKTGPERRVASSLR